MPAPATEEAPDVLVRGGGPVGCAAALALHASGWRVAVVDPAPVRDAFRPLALSYASRLVLERVGAWGAFAATPIESVLVSQQGAFGRTRLDAADAELPALGYVADYAAVTQALRARVERASLWRTGEALAAKPRLTVHAEGGVDLGAEKRYAQDALVARVTLERPASTTAFERFTSEGPLALLPFSGDYAVVWSVRPERSADLAGCSDADFLRALADAAGAGIGAPRSVAARAAHPLSLRVRGRRISDRSCYIGNAAQTLHPVAGQGLNLGLRDAWDLARILRGAPDPGAAALLERYRSIRALDAFATVRATDFLAGAFTGSNRLARAARGLALTALDILPAPRRFFARRMVFGPSALP